MTSFSVFYYKLGEFLIRRERISGFFSSLYTVFVLFSAFFPSFSHSFLLAFNFPSLSLSIQPDLSHRFCLTELMLFRTT